MPINQTNQRQGGVIPRRAGYWLGLVLAAISGMTADGMTLQPILSGHVPAAVHQLTALGDLPETNQLPLALGLPVRDGAGLTNFLQDVYNPASPNFHHFLKPGEFADRFGPTAADYAAVLAYATAHGLQITGTHANRLVVDVVGSPATVAKAFHTHLRVYRHPTEARNFYAPDTEPTLDATVPILHVAGLDNYQLPHARHGPVTAAPLSRPVAQAGSGPGGAYLANDFRAAYAPGVSLTGAGQSVALVQFNSGFYAADIAAYQTAAGLTNIPVATVQLDGYDGGPGADNGEVSLDIEMAMAMAPGLARVQVYEGSTPDDVLNQIATDDAANQVSASWTYATDATTTEIYQQFAAQGQSFFNSAGDADAYAGTVTSPCDNPYITVVGGTSLSLNSTGTAWGSETVWNEADGTGTGGGISTAYSIPAWQTNVNMSANGGSTGWRNLPDVAMAADNVWVCYGNGQTGTFSGTSCATPLWAAFTALVNQQAAAEAQAPVGFLNPSLYQIGNSTTYHSAFHDITTGNNTNAASPTAYQAVTGYDLCTGWGTPAGQALINSLAPPAVLQVSPVTGFSVVGRTNGPFSATSPNLTLTNTGSATLNWGLVNTSAWLNVYPPDGSLSGGRTKSLKVVFNAATSNLVVGTYQTTLTFTDSVDTVSPLVNVTLQVLTPPTVVTGLQSIAVYGGQTATFQVTAAGSLPLSYQWKRFLNDFPVTTTNLGTSAAELVITNTETNNMGFYEVVITNAVGAVTNGPVGLAVIAYKPIIYLAPSNQMVYADEAAQESVAVIGSPPFFYQWQHAGTNVTGATNATLAWSAVAPAQAGSYSVTITNSYGSVTSSNVILEVLTNSPCVSAPAGLVSWWPGEGSPVDVAGTNVGVAGPGLTYAPAEVGDGFVFENTNAYVRIPASDSLNVGAGSGFTLEGWINVTNVNGLHPIAEWKSASGQLGVQFWIGEQPTDEGVLCVTMVDTNNNNYTQIATASGTIAPDVFQHVALTYNGTNGRVALFVNGTNVLKYNWGIFPPATQFDLWLGAHPDVCDGGCPSDATTLGGVLDEFSLYNRALSTNELAAIYTAHAGGKCEPVTAPYIVAPAPVQTVVVGGSVTLSVLAAGTPPLSYQWLLNGTNFPGGTNATLTLSPVESSLQSCFTVVVTNLFGATNTDVGLTLVPNQYVWNGFSARQFVNVPFTVTLEAEDASGNQFTSFSGTLDLTTTNGLAITPTVSGSLTNGIWTGTVTIPAAASNVVLAATDVTGNTGLSLPISVEAPPTLTTRFTGSTPLLQWPAAATGFVLETTTDLTAGTWTEVTNEATPVGDQWQIPVNATDSRRFFRLRLAGE